MTLKQMALCCGMEGSAQRITLPLGHTGGRFRSAGGLKCVQLFCNTGLRAANCATTA